MRFQLAPALTGLLLLLALFASPACADEYCAIKGDYCEDSSSCCFDLYCDLQVSGLCTDHEVVAAAPPPPHPPPSH